MSQPQWEFVANLGDVNYLDHGGYFVFRDTSGVYAPEAEWLEVPEADDSGRPYRVYRFILEPCTFQGGVLSDNPFHPTLPAWFATPERERQTRPQDTTYLADVARMMGTTRRALVKLFCSADPIDRAHAWRMIGEYHGWENLDQYPLTLSREEAETRYAGRIK